MGIQAFQKFIETNCPTASVPVDLLKIARSVGVRRTRNSNACGGRSNNHHNHNNNNLNNSGCLSLVVDGECCLDRLYGGFFSDWVCGGQWNRMVQFLAVLIQTIQNNNIELAVFFNGSLESQRMSEWIKVQQNERKKISQVLKHVEMKGTPPPKVWWLPPICLQTCLRMALRHLNIAVVCTMDDHHQEVIAYCRENHFHGLMAEDAEYAIFDPPRYFSSEQLKLTYKGSLETKEFILDEVAKQVNLNPNRFCIFAALLGNYLLTEEELAEFYAGLSIENRSKASPDVVIKAVCEFVRGLPSIDNLDAVGAQIFTGNYKGRPDVRIQKFKECVQYYLNGTKDGFLRYRPPTVGSSSTGSKVSPFCHYKKTKSCLGRKEPGHYVATWASNVPPTHQNEADSGKFASETREIELSSLSAYKEATLNQGGQSSSNPQIVIDPPGQVLAPQGLNEILKEDGTDTSNKIGSLEPVSDKLLENDLSGSDCNRNGEGGAEGGSGGICTNGLASSASLNRPQVNGGVSLLSSSTSSSSSLSSPNRQSPDVSSWSGTTAPVQPKVQGTNSAVGGYPHQPQPAVYLPPIPPEVMRTTSERHQKGLMSPWIFQVLTQGEFKVPVCMEEDVPTELPSSALLYRPIRQMVYAILFNLHHMQYQIKQKREQSSNTADEAVPDILVKEWVWTKYNQYRNPDLVKAEPLGWPVPTVQRLWFGSALDDKKRRLRAFLTCMRSDTPLMLATSYVPHHLLIMCCVLRYILSQSDVRILRRQELNAFLAQAVSPRLMDAQFMQNMQLPMVSTRGVQLAALFMRGVETALFANDACGAPIPFLMCCPWLFFDGKLLHFKLLKSNESKDLLDICDGQTDQVLKVERMRQAILKGLKVEFARRPLPNVAPVQPRLPGLPPSPFVPAGAPWANVGRGRGNVAGRRTVLARGGQLEIAGVVVGSWGANFGTGLRGRGGVHVAPQVTSVGPRRGKPGYMQRYNNAAGGGFQHMPMGRGLPSYSVRRPPARGRRPAALQTQANRKNKKSSRVSGGGGKGPVVSDGDAPATRNVGRGCTVKTGDRTVVSATEFIKDNYTAECCSSSSKCATKGQFEDATGELKLPKSSPIIMKKPSVEEDATTVVVVVPNDVEASATVSVESPDSSVNVTETTTTTVVAAEQ